MKNVSFQNIVLMISDIEKLTSKIGSGRVVLPKSETVKKHCFECYKSSTWNE